MENHSLSEYEFGNPLAKLKKLKKLILSLLAFFLIVFGIYFFFLSAPEGFLSGTIIKIEQGSNLRSVSLQLKEENLIRSRLMFEAIVILYGGEKHIMYSYYLFEKKLSVFEIARRIARGDHHIASIALTIPEGFDLDQIADTAASKLFYFNKSKFLLQAKELEGTLFPDTYFFLVTSNEEDVILSMSKNFEKKMITLLPDITKTKKTEREILIMASIIEREAKGDGDREFISGILWNRIAIGMLLQADAAPDTYKKRGLPESPISNPGLSAIKAAIYPEKSSYFYYLHDKSGNIHYAKTFTEHQANIRKYLK